MTLPLFFAQLLLVPTVGGGIDNDVERIVLMHRAAVEALNTFSCSVRFEERNLATHSNCAAQGKYVRQGLAIRATESGYIPGLTRHFLADGGIVKIFERGPTYLGAAIRNQHERALTSCDVWNRALIEPLLPNTLMPAPLGKHVKEAARAKLRTITANGREFMVLELEYENMGYNHTRWSSEITLDPEKNYLVCEAAFRNLGGTDVKVEMALHYRIKEFREVLPGVFFPKSTEYIYSADGKPSHVQTAEFDDISVNAPIRPGGLGFAFPYGIEVSDSIRGTKYKVDQDGRRISMETPLQLKVIGGPGVLLGTDE